MIQIMMNIIRPNKDSLNGSILFWNLVLLMISVVVGKYLYSESLGWGDSLAIFKNKIGFFEFVLDWYFHINGRLGQAILTGLFLPLRWISSSPEAFPWWLISSFCLFCTIGAAFNFAASITKLLSGNKLAIIFAILCIAWFMNPVAFYNREFFTLMELVGYSLPTYLISIFVYNTSIASNLYSLKVNIFVFASAVFFSLLGEQYLLAVPILFFGYLIVKMGLGQLDIKSVFKLMLLYVVGILIGLLIYFFSPGQIFRKSLLIELKPFSIWKTYEFPIITTYQFIFNLSDSVLVKWSSFIVFGHSIFLVVIILLIARSITKVLKGSLDKWDVSFYFIAFYLIAFHLCFATLLIASYLPGYAFFFPLVLLQIPLIILIGNITSYPSSGFHKKVLTGIFFVLAGFILYRNIVEDSLIHKLAVDNNTRRRNIFERVYSLSKENGPEKYILINCPLAYPKFGWTMEPPWGISGYFTWRGNEKIKVFLTGNSDVPDNWEDGTYTLISCKDL